MSLCPAFLIVNLPDLRELLQSTQQCRPVLECQAREKRINGPGAEGQGARDGNAGLLCKKRFVKKQRAATRAAQIPLDWTFCRVSVTSFLPKAVVLARLAVPELPAPGEPVFAKRRTCLP